MKLYVYLFAFFLSVPAWAQTTWSLDKSHTNIRFSATHMVVTEVDGNFTDFDGKVVASNKDFDGAQIEFSANVASVNTGNERRDNHLRSDDFFNAEKYPKLTFSGMLQKDGDQYFLVGDFTIRDVTKQVKFPTKFNGTVQGRRGMKAGFKITGSIKRFDYGLKWDNAMDSGGLVVSDEISITCNVELNEVIEN